MKLKQVVSLKGVTKLLRILHFSASRPITSNNPEPIPELSSCWVWYNEETSQNSWYSFVEQSTNCGCPRRIGSQGGTDADAAERELQRGLNGWGTDPCCGGTPVNSCKNCKMNPGAAFCIQAQCRVNIGLSGGSLIVEKSTVNQCCYSHSGKLLTQHNEGAGYPKRTANKLYSADFLTYELQPFEQCCEKESQCNLYWETRPVFIGTYTPRLRRVGRGEPHFESLDGFQFTFNPLGVYNMVEKPKENDSTLFSMHVSFRRAGNGTVFSGFALTDDLTTAEFFLTVENETIVIINGIEINVNLFSELEKDDIQFSRNENFTEFTFYCLNSDFFVQASIFEQGILTLSLSPPMSVRGKTSGLLGNFDGVTENDLLSKGNLLEFFNLSLISY